MAENKKLLLLILCLFAVVGVIWVFTRIDADPKEGNDGHVSSNPHFIRMRDTIVDMGKRPLDRGKYKALKNELYQLFTQKPVQLLNDKEYASLSSLLKNGYFTVLAKQAETYCKTAALGDPLGATLSSELDGEFEQAFQPERRSSLKGSLSRHRSASTLSGRVGDYVRRSAYSQGRTSTLLAETGDISNDPMLKTNARVTAVCNDARGILYAHRELGESIQKLISIDGMDFCSDAIKAKPVNRTFSYYVNLCDSHQK